MKKILVGFLCGCLLLGGCGQAQAKQVEKMEFESGMEKFPSYDWDGEDATYLAYVIANTGGTEKNKQEAALRILDTVWYDDSNLSICDYVSRNYELYNTPDERDYELVKMLITGEWGND